MSNNDSDRLPFEPNRKRKKSQPEQPSTSQKKADKPVEAASVKRSEKRKATEAASIPEVVSRRMLRRSVIFSGVPVILGVAIFFTGYIVITQHIADLPNVVIFLATLACFGLSVIGLSYGALSASWDEDAVGSMIGFDQFQLNAGRMVDSWRQAKEDRQSNS